MPKAQPSNKFYIYDPAKSGRLKGRRLLGADHKHKDNKKLTLRDLVEFLEEQGIPLSKVKLSGSFITTADR